MHSFILFKYSDGGTGSVEYCEAGRIVKSREAIDPVVEIAAELSIMEAGGV